MSKKATKTPLALRDIADLAHDPTSVLDGLAAARALAREALAVDGDGENQDNAPDAQEFGEEL